MEVLAVLAGSILIPLTVGQQPLKGEGRRNGTEIKPNGSLLAWREQKTQVTTHKAPSNIINSGV